MISTIDGGMYVTILRSLLAEQETAKGGTNHFWAMLLDPRTKKFIARVLPHEIDRDRL
jgi:hypothetical protein